MNAPMKLTVTLPSGSADVAREVELRQGRSERKRSPLSADRSGFVRSTFFYLAILVMAAIYLFPFYWMALSSLKTQLANSAYPPVFWFRPTLDNYYSVFNNNPFALYLWNSLVVGVASTALGLIIGLPAAYGIARSRAEGLAIAVLLARIAPGISYLVPWFIIFAQLELIGSYTALVLAHLTVGLPLTIWITIPFFEDIPLELEDAAFIDGATTWQFFSKVALPLVMPGIATAAILSFIQSWNTFMYSVVLSNSDTRTLPVAVFGFLSYGGFDWGSLTAAATVITIPVMLLALVVQRHIVGGLAAGGVKA
jgi:multiple sugar transport system permease protein